MNIEIVNSTYARDFGDYDGKCLELWIGDTVITIGYGRKR